MNSVYASMGLRSERERERSEREEYHLHLGSKSPNRMPLGWRWWWVAVASMCFPSAYANPRSVGNVGEGRLRTINLVRRAGRPPHPLYSAATRAHQPENGWTPPIRTREGEWIESLDSVPCEINLTISSHDTCFIQTMLHMRVCHDETWFISTSMINRSARYD
jgi:hypothetical protein